MFDYLDWRGDLSFENAPINAVDLLIFATLSYCPLERMPGGFTPGTLAQLTAELYPPDAAFRNDAEKQRCQLWKTAAESERFGGVQVQEFAYHFDPAGEKQFSATLFQLDERTAVAAFRGTDSTVVGWKEDFNMGFESPVPAQTDAVEFLTAAARQFERLYTCGHSKGGNLALYAAVRSPADVRAKVMGVYSFDGPGLDDQTAGSPEYEEILLLRAGIFHRGYAAGLSRRIYHCGQRRRRHFAAQSLPVAHSRAAFPDPGQPDPLRPLRRSDAARLSAQCTTEERQVMVDTLFELVAATGAQRVKEIPMGLLKNFGAVRETLKKVPEENQLVLKKVFRTLAQAGGSNLDALLSPADSGDGATAGQ